MATAVVLLLMAAGSAPTLDPSNCQSYEAKLESRPDMTHKVVIAQSTLPQDFPITSVQRDTNKRRSFYWCEMTVDDGDGQERTMRRFGHNDTHWWVTNGCGGTFIVQGCKGARQSSAHSSPNPLQTPTIITYTSSAVRNNKMEQTVLHFEDLDSGAFDSLKTWLKEEGAAIRVRHLKESIQDKLGGKPNNRPPCSVDEEFELEFGKRN